MSELKVTSLDEIRKQAEPTIIEIPGFRPGATINVAVKRIDMSPYLLQVGIGNPMITADTKPNAIAVQVPFDKLLPILDAIAKEALVQPTYDEIISIEPLTLEQKLTILDYTLGELKTDELASFRKE